MPAPAYAAAGAGDAVAGDIAVPFPAGIAAGDLLLLQLLHRGIPASNPTATDFTLLYGAFGDTTPQWVLAKSASGSESGTIAVARPGGSDAFIGRMYRVTGWLNDATMTANFESGATLNGLATNIDQPSVTTGGVERLVVAFVGVRDDNALDAFTGTTGGTWAEAVAEFTTIVGADGALGLQTATLASAGTISGGVDTMAASDPWRVHAFAIKPAAAALAAIRRRTVLQAVQRATF